MRIWLFVEGPSDGEAIKTLARKALGQSRVGLDFTALVSGVRRFDTIRSHIEALLKLRKDVSRVIVCADQHSDPVIKEQAERTEKDLKNATLPVPVKYVKVLHALEGWLLADLDALRRTLGSRARLGKVPQQLESRCDQVGLLDKLFRRNGREYEKEKAYWAPRIASHANPSVIAARMSSFREFLDALRDPE